MMFPIIKPIIAKGITAALGLLMLGGTPLCSTRIGSHRNVALFPLPEWQNLGLQYGDELMLRASTNGALLLKHTRSEIVYRFEPRQSLTAVGSTEWNRLKSSIAVCAWQSPPMSVLRIDSYKLFASDRPITTAGRTVLKLASAPSGKRVAVLSASGSAATSILPFVGASGASGRYYHQVMSLPEVEPVGQPVEVPMQHEYDSLIPCWSTDERYVVYHEVTFHFLSIVTTSLSTPARTGKGPK